jgi:hypothetical protein
MMLLGILVAGFAGGWVIRSTVDSRGLAVGGVSAVYGALERGRRILAIEREHLEDLVAEGRAKHQMRRLKAAPSQRDVQEAAIRPPTDISKRGRAA